MSQPGAKLYQLLAESNARAAQCLEIGKKSASTLEQRHQRIQREIAELRETIQRQGLGTDPSSEDRYMELLSNFRQLHQSHQLNAALPNPPTTEAELAKALDYAEMLVSVYGAGVLAKLAKAALPDLAAQASHLRQWRHPQALALASQLDAIAANPHPSLDAH